MTRWRSYPALIAAVLWLMWAVDASAPGSTDRAGKPKGTDFLQFYVAASLVRDGRADELYDIRATDARARAIAPGARDALYVPIQSPAIAVALQPLAALPYARAWMVWTSLLAAAFAAACLVLWRGAGRLRAHPVESAAFAAALPAFYSTVLHGQLSAFALLLVALALWALRRDARFGAGLLVGCLAFKPHWVAAASVLFVAAREWRVVGGIVVSAAGQLALACAALGPRVAVAYAGALRSISAIGDLLEPRPSLSLRGLTSVLVADARASLVVYAVCSALVVSAAAHIWRTSQRDEWRYSAWLLATALISPHVLEYDLLLLAPVFVLLGSWILEAPEEASRRLAIYCAAVLFAAPILTPLPAAVRVPLIVGAAAALFAAIAFTVLESSAARAAGILSPS